MSEHVLVSIADGVMEIRLDRAEKRNALTVAMYQAMADALVTSETNAAGAWWCPCPWS